MIVSHGTDNKRKETETEMERERKVEATKAHTHTHKRKEEEFKVIKYWLPLHCPQTLPPHTAPTHCPLFFLVPIHYIKIIALFDNFCFLFPQRKQAKVHFLSFIFKVLRGKKRQKRKRIRHWETK